MNNNHRLFVAWDGEGAGNKYILLRNSRDKYISNINGLSTLDCLSFMLAESQHDKRGTKNVIFGGGYDVNMILRDMDRKSVYILWTYGRVKWKDYLISYIPRKTFSVTHGKQTFTLWDTYGFFQSSFVAAIRSWLPDYDQTMLDNIIAHKAERSTFNVDSLDDINTYCAMEIDALVQIMEKLEHSARSINVHLTRYDGAGAIAAALLHKYKVKESMYDYATTEPEMHQEAWRAYAGGRIECVQYGHSHSKVWHGDINSAYPTVIRVLPNLSSCKCEYTTRYSHGVYAIWRISFNFSGYRRQPFYPFFYREPSGRIIYPIMGKGSYWSPEVDAAMAHMPEGITVHDGWIFRPRVERRNTVPDEDGGNTICHARYSSSPPARINERNKDAASHECGTADRNECTSDPFHFIPLIYKERQELKKRGDAAQIVLKLGMNSLYGKLAQQVGYKKGVKPAYQQIEWAGYITSQTRATLYTVAMQHPESVIMFSTDGLFSTVEHDVKAGKELGEWDVQWHDEMTIAQSGVYWYRDGDDWHDKTRGYDKDTQRSDNPLSRDSVIKAYEELRWRVEGTNTRFIGMGAALRSKWENWCTWPTEIRELLLLAHGSKRVDCTPWWTTNDNPSLRLFQTVPLISEYAYAGETSSIYRKSIKNTVLKKLDNEEMDGRL